jgi:Holliday junction DNA helicase RuvB
MMDNLKRADDHRIIDATFLDEDNVEKSLRPQTLEEFIGQDKLRDNLRVFVQAARDRKQALDHVLLYGPPGLGKTTLAQIVAREMGVSFKATSAPIITKSGDLAAILTNLQPNDVLFIDEIHRLTPQIEEVLYPAMEDHRLDLMIGEGPTARSIQIDLSPFTLVGATTRSGLITTPLRERFGIPMLLNYYSHDELAMIVSRNAKLLDVKITDEGTIEIAKRARGTPRIAGRLLRRVRDFASVMKQSSITAQIADEVLTRLDVDKTGLDALDRRYLKCLAENYGGGPVGVDTMAAILSEQRDMLEEVIEPYLLQQGFIQRTQRGRMLSSFGYQYLGLKPKAS